jgi:hypothetical protein
LAACRRLKKLRWSLILSRKYWKQKFPKNYNFEEEAKDAAQNRKVVANSSAKMCSTLESSMQIFEGIARSLTKTSTISDKLSAMQQNIVGDICQKSDEKFLHTFPLRKICFRCKHVRKELYYPL